MCDVGGPRCEYASEWLKVKRKLHRSKKYQEAWERQRKQLEWEARNSFHQARPDLLAAHLPQRARWQTKAKPLPRRRMEALQKLFPKPEVLSLEAGQELALAMRAERDELVTKVTSAEVRALSFYTMAGFEAINSYLRRGLKGLAEARDLSYEERVRESIESLDKLFEHAPTPEEPRVLYRHMLVPAGMTPQEYAERYFKVGERTSDPAFMSTTQDTGYIRGHAHARRPSEYLVLQILSSQGVSLQEEPEAVGSIQSWEKERLLPRGTKLRVAGTRRLEFSVPESRWTLRKQFSDSYAWLDKIPPKRFTVVQLVDEQDIS